MGVADLAEDRLELAVELHHQHAETPAQAERQREETPSASWQSSVLGP